MPRLLSTKLQPPPLRDEWVNRPEVYEQLGAFDSGVLVVSAPPGFGKSTLVAEWLSVQNRPFTWYSLDRYDSDVGLFAEYLGTAVEKLVGAESGLLSLPGEQTPDTRAMIATLLDDLSEAPGGSVLVLDDYHQVESQEVHEVVNYLIDNLPEALVVAIISRADPPLPLSRLRSQGRLREIRGADLRFTAAQIVEYFELSPDVDLDATQLESVVERSEGWVAALHLVRLGLEQRPSATMASLSVNHPFIAAYLVDEVLDRMRPELASFLLQTSPFERFDHELCSDVLGIANASELIAEIERQNALLIRLGGEGEWYRYHHLFADLLRSRLNRSSPGRADEVLVGAAGVCEKRGLADDAIDYALKAGDLVLAADIVDRNMGRVLGAGEVARLRSWLRLFPVPADPVAHTVALGWAWCRVFEGHLEAATELVDQIETEMLDDFTVDPSGQLEVMRAIVALQAGDASAAEEHALLALERLPAPSPYLESLAHLYVGRALQARALRVEARPHLERAASLAERGNTFAAAIALFGLGVTDMDLGNLVDAERSMSAAQEVAARASTPRSSPHPAAGVGDIGMAYIRLNQLEVDEAVRLADRGTRLLERSTFAEMVFRGFFVWAEALSSAGRFDESEAISDAGIKWLQGRRLGGGPLETWLLMVKARNSWRRGDLDGSAQLLDRVMRRGLGSQNWDEKLGFYEAADAVSHALRRGDAEDARRLLAEVPVDPTENVMFSIKRLVLAAALHELDGDSRQAVESVEEALDLAVQGYRFQFSFVTPVIRPVLDRMLGRTTHDDLLRSIVERLPLETEVRFEQPVDPLTDREIEVLAEIASGYSNEEIADRLFISRGTVKRHASNIYLKLGVHHRAEAAARGREMGLIT